MAEDFLTLTEFIPGTKAKAQEVNANFSALKSAVESKASMTGDSTQNFYVATATEQNHAVTKSQLDSFSESLNEELDKIESKFCVKSGNTTNGNGDLFSQSGLTITTKTGTGYESLIAANYLGTKIVVNSSLSLTMQGKPDGTYHIFLKHDGTIYSQKNSIFVQKARPSMYSGDIWLNTSKTPLTCVQYDGSTDKEFLDVPLGKVEIENSAITSLKTLPFNQNGYDVNIYSIPKYKYDYANPISKASGTSYTAESDGLLFIRHSNLNDAIGITIEGFFYNMGWSSSQGSGSVGTLPITKGQTYQFSGGEARYFIPLIEA